MERQDRRTFLKVASLAAVGSSAACAAEGVKPVDRRVLGRTGVEVSLLGLGLGSAFTNNDDFKDKPDNVRAILERALALGINYWDTANAYGPSQRMIGPVLKDHRDKVFLATKAGPRTYDGYMRELEKSLRELQTDYIDLFHCHNLGSQAADKADLKALEDGCVKAARKAKEEGTIRFWGVTGHSGGTILAEFVKLFDPDCCQTVFPASGRGSDYEKVFLPLAIERNMGVTAMKVIRQDKDSGLKGSDLPRYALSVPGITCAVVGLAKLTELDENARMATDFKPLPEDQRVALANRVKLAVGHLTPPWAHPHYQDGLVV